MSELVACVAESAGPANGTAASQISRAKVIVIDPALPRDDRLYCCERSVQVGNQSHGRAGAPGGGACDPAARKDGYDPSTTATARRKSSGRRWRITRSTSHRSRCMYRCAYRKRFSETEVDRELVYNDQLTARLWALNSAVECHLHTLPRHEDSGT